MTSQNPNPNKGIKGGGGEEKEDGKENEEVEVEGRWRGDGGIRHDATFSWSRALIHPPRCNRMCYRVIHGREVPGAMP